jgi:hypothetical protein
MYESEGERSDLYYRYFNGRVNTHVEIGADYLNAIRVSVIVLKLTRIDLDVVTLISLRPL